MLEYKLIKLKKTDKKKFAVVTPNGKIIKFGANGYEDYTMHHDSKRKSRYIKRHAANENWNDLERAGTWSRYVLWEKSDLDSALNNMEKKFGIRIIY